MTNWKYIRYDIEERLEPIVEKLAAARQWLHERKTLSTILMISFIAIMLFVVCLGQFKQDKELKSDIQSRSWFYDLNTGKLFTTKAGQLPPIEAPSGPLPDGQPAGVKAYVFSYASEPDNSNQYIAFLETFTPQAKKQLLKFMKSKTDPQEAMKVMSKGRLVCRVDQMQWLAADSDEGRDLINQAWRPNKNEEYPHPYQPND